MERDRRAICRRRCRLRPPDVDLPPAPAPLRPPFPVVADGIRNFSPLRGARFPKRSSELVRQSPFRGNLSARSSKFDLIYSVRLLDRYVIRNFLQAYIYCIAGFLSIWLIFDISDNISTFIDEHFGFGLTARYYATQVPQVFIILLPVALLLALLFSLGRMSRSKEIVSMLTAGISIPRLLTPLIAMGLVTVGASFALNYELAPHAELAKKNFIATARAHEVNVQGQIFRNRTDLRTWFIQSFRPGHNIFNNVQVLQQDAHDNIVENYLTPRATYHAESKTWEFENVKVVLYDAAGNITDEKMLPLLKIDHWSETPFRLGSANVRAEFLSVPELHDYLHFNSDFPVTLLAPFRTHFQYR